VFTKTKGKKAVNHYPHHIGDFDKATRHLSRLERSIYRDLIDLYYDTEKPLPLDIAMLARRIIAVTKEEITALEVVLAEFFINTPDGWRNKRCDKEIEEYHSNVEGARRAGVASGLARRAKSKREANGRSTGVEEKSNGRSTGVEHSLNQPEPEPIITPSASQSPPAGGAAVAAEPVRKARKRRLPGDWAPTEAHRDLAQKLGKNLDRELAQFCDHHRAKGSEFFDWDAALNTWLRRDFTTNTTQKHDQREQRRAREFPEEIHLKSVYLRGIAGEGPDGVGALEQRGRVGRDFGAQQIAETPSVAQNDSRPLLAGGGGAVAVVHPDGIPNGLAWASGRRENAVGSVDCVGGGAIGAATGLSNGQRIATRDELSVL
jgi:uncharacterized protein YdaU (DUF1376 family)